MTSCDPGNNPAAHKKKAALERSPGNSSFDAMQPLSALDADLAPGSDTLAIQMHSESTQRDFCVITCPERFFDASFTFGEESGKQ